MTPRRHRIGTLLLGLLVCAAPAVVGARDLTVEGRRLSWRTDRQDPLRRRATIVLHDAAITAPFPDPSNGAALIISAGSGPGQCWKEIALDSTKWQPIGGDGQRGYAYRDSAAAGGVRSIVIRPGQIAVHGQGAGWPCDLQATQQRTPVSVVLRIGSDRYCAAFGGTVVANASGRVLAVAAPAPAACPKTDLTAATLNILHGVLCPRPSRACRLTDRIPLLFDWIVGRGCPDVVTLQEVSTQVVARVTEHVATACPFAYEIVHQASLLGIDDEMILTRYPVVTREVVPLYRDFRHLLFARLDHPLGPVDVFTTHLASSSDQAEAPCAEDCPPLCVAAGAATVRDCQAVQLADYVMRRHDVPTPALVTGDFNDGPGSFLYTHVVGKGWVDVYRAAGNPECDAATGIGCTSGRADEDLSGLESPLSNEIERIDYIFLVPPAPASQCVAALDTPDDADGDHTGTRLFANQPNPFAPACGPAPDPICWPSDHEGVEVDLNCAG